jgi:hypothetical protein
MIIRMTLGELKKKQSVWARWMREAVETLDNSDEIIAHYKTTPAGNVLTNITFDEFGPPVS